MTIRSRKHTLASQPLLNQSLLAMAAIGLPLTVYAQAQEKTMAEVKVGLGAGPAAVSIAQRDPGATIPASSERVADLAGRRVEGSLAEAGEQRRSLRSQPRHRGETAQHVVGTDGGHAVAQGEV